jgi:hypothetical protein
MRLDRSSVEEAVSAQFEQREGVALDLVCDRVMLLEPDARYPCAGVTADGEEVEIEVTVTDASGAYTWSET